MASQSETRLKREKLEDSLCIILIPELTFYNDIVNAVHKMADFLGKAGIEGYSPNDRKAVIENIEARLSRRRKQNA